MDESQNHRKFRIKQPIQTLIDQLVKMKPATAKGTYVRSISVSSTMSPSVRINPGVAAIP